MNLHLRNGHGGEALDNRPAGMVFVEKMSLLAELRQIAEVIDPGLAVQANEVSQVVTALVHYVEHGDALKAAAIEGTKAVTELLSPPPPVAPAPAPAGPSEDYTAVLQELEQLRQSLAIAQAAAHPVEVVHEPAPAAA